MTSTPPLTDESIRILRAAQEDRLRRGADFRWSIEDDRAPVRAEREWLQRNRLLAYADGHARLVPTEAGRAALEAEAVAA